MVDQTTPSEPSLHILLSYLETKVLPFKRRLGERIDAMPGLRQTVCRLQEQEAPIDEIYLQAQKYCDSHSLDQRVLDIWFDYHKAREYCMAQWEEWEDATSKTGPMTRINTLGLWRVCAFLTSTEIEEISILLHVDRLVWHLAHLLDDVVDTRTPHAARLLREKGDGIVCTLRVLCEFNTPGSRGSASEYYRQFERDYLAHLSHSMPEKPLVEQLYHKLIPDTITAGFYNDIMKLVVGDKFDVEETKHAMREAMYAWQVLDDLADYAEDIRAEVANISLMCLQQTRENLPQPADWPTVEQVARLLPRTVSLLQQVFHLLCQWLRGSRPDVLKFLFTDFERVYQEKWHYILNNDPDWQCGYYKSAF